MGSTCRFPVIGPWLYRRKIHALAKAAVKRGDVMAVKELAAILCSSGDPDLSGRARAGLAQLTSPQAITCICKEAMATRDPHLIRLVRENRYVPEDKATRALFFLAMGITDGTSDVLTVQGYARAELRVKEGVLSGLISSGRCSRFADLLLNAGSGAGTKPWSPGECRVIIAGLAQECRWGDLWRVLFSFPLPQAAQALRTLQASGWKPFGSEEALFLDLCCMIPVTGLFPVREPRLDTTLEQAAGQTTRFCFSPDSRSLVTAGSDGTIRCRDVSRGTVRHSFSAGNGAVRALAITPDGTKIVTIGSDSVLRCHAMQTGELLWEDHIADNRCAGIAITPDSSRVITGNANGTIRMNRCDDGTAAGPVIRCGAGIRQVAISPDGGTLAIATEDHQCVMVRPGNPGQQESIPIPDDELRSLLFTEGGRAVLGIPSRLPPFVCNPASDQPVRSLAGHTGSVTCWTLSGDGSYLCFGCDDGFLYIGTLNGGRFARKPMYNRRLTSCATAGGLLVAGCIEGSIRVFRLSSGELVKEFKAHDGPVTALAGSPDGNHLASTGWDGTVRLWILPSFEPERILQGQAGEVTCLCGTTDGSTVFAGSTDGTVRVFSTAKGCLVRMLDMYTPKIRALAVSPDGTLLACAGADASLHLWSTADGSLVCRMEGLSTSARCLVFTSDGKELISGGWDGSVRCWQVPEGRLSRTLTGHTSIITACALSPDDRTLVTGSNDTTIQIRDIAGGNPLRLPDDGGSEVSALASSNDGQFFASGKTDGSIRILYAPEGREKCVVQSVPGKVTCLAFTDDGEAFIAGYDSGIVLVCSADTGAVIGRFPAHTGAVTGMCIIPKKDRLVTGGRDGAVRVWHLPWTRTLRDTTPEDVARVAAIADVCTGETSARSWRFLELVLRAKCRNEIGICDTAGVAGLYDIQIAG